MKYLKKFWLPVAIILTTLGLFHGDTEQFLLQLYTLSTVTMVLLASHFMLDDRADWGLFPYLDLSDLVERAKETATGAAIVFASVIYLLATIISVAVMRH